MFKLKDMNHNLYLLKYNLPKLKELKGNDKLILLIQILSIYNDVIRYIPVKYLYLLLRVYAICEINALQIKKMGYLRKYARHEYSDDLLNKLNKIIVCTELLTFHYIRSNCISRTELKRLKTYKNKRLLTITMINKIASF